MTRYENTPENARTVGWIHMPEYCRGDKNLPFVWHDEVRGLFFFASE